MTQAEQTYTQAVWYAWGMHDSGAIPGLTLDHGWRFAELRRAARESFDRQETYVFGSMMEDWRVFLAAQGLAHPQAA